MPADQSLPVWQPYTHPEVCGHIPAVPPHNLPYSPDLPRFQKSEAFPHSFPGRSHTDTEYAFS